MGQGLGANIGLATAMEIGEYVAGAGVSYLFKHTFEPFKDIDYEYNPGDEITVSAGVDRNLELLEKETRITADVVYTIYGSDQGGGEKVFKSGNKLMIQFLSHTKLEKFDLVLFIRERLKGKNITSIGDVFEEERKNSNGNEFEISGQAIFPYSERTQLSGLMDLKIYGNNEYETGGALLFGVGGGSQLEMSERMVLDSTVKFYIGNIKSSAESTGLYGIELTGGLKYYF
jgi:hypothetical protein